MICRLLLFMGLLPLLICCQRSERKLPRKQKNIQSVAPPVVIQAGDPVVLELSKQPSPRVLELADKPGGSYQIKTSKGIQSIALLPPQVQEAGFVAHMQHYNTEQGLGLSTVASAYLDKAGQLWFGTNGGGVSRFNGQAFTTYTTSHGLAGNDVISILQDTKGNMWFGTDAGGISFYDGARFTNFSTHEGLAHNTINSIAEDKAGNIWFASGAGAVRYDGNRFTTFNTSSGLAGNGVNSIKQDNNGNLWFGTTTGVSRYDGRSFTNFTIEQGLADNFVSSILLAKDGSLWFGTVSGATHYNGKTFRNYSIEQGLAGNFIRSIVQDHNGNIWFGSNHHGLSCFDGQTFTSFTNKNGLPSNDILAIVEDKEGHLWFGTNGGGLVRYEGSSLSTYTTAQGLADNSVFSVAPDMSGNMWFGTTSGGASRYDGRTFTNLTTAQGLTNNNVISLCADKAGNMWLGTANGVNRFDGKSITSYTTFHGLAGRLVSVTICDKDSNIWFGTNNGASRFDGKSFTNYTTDQGLAGNRVNNIVQDSRNGDMWFATNGGGISRFNGNTFTNYTVAQGLASDYVMSMIQDNAGNLWFGTDGAGISRFDGSTFLNFSTDQGLPDNMVYDMAEREKSIIFGTNLGLAALRFQARQSGKPSDGQPAVSSLSNLELLAGYKPVWQEFNTKTGYPVKDININAMYCDSTGVIWAGTGDEKTGLVRFDYSAVRSNSAAPHVFIRKIKLNEENICWYNFTGSPGAGTSEKYDSTTLAQQQVLAYGKLLTEAETDSFYTQYQGVSITGVTDYYPVPQGLVLPFGINSITIEFGALELARPQLVSYQYKLVGYDNAWSPVLKNTSATFGNIKEGNYTFLLKARGPSGIWSEPLAYTFRVLPPWYRTWWAIAAYALLFTAGLILLVKWRTGRLKREKALLEAKVNERTEELSKEKERSEQLLLNILPPETAAELKEYGRATARSYESATVLFADIRGFTEIAGSMAAEKVVSLLDEYFHAFDDITEHYQLEKIKTIGDAYLCAGGLSQNGTHIAADVVRAALAMQAAVRKLKKEHISIQEPYFELRIGINTGPVVAGVVGVKKFAYDIWGDTVNTAARMEQSSEAGKVNISKATYELVKNAFECKPRGLVEVKGKGEMEMYFVEREIAEMVQA